MSKLKKCFIVDTVKHFLICLMSLLILVILVSFEAQAQSSSKPHYAVHLVGSLSPLGGTPDVPGATLDQTRAYAVSLGLEYQPEFLQAFLFL